ncbi:MAG TPA: copper homeostasis membrane protein CopD [Acidimicrobiia bacterium]|nr:copper homeostasis membrane protein CopD [Acidimicrobiia bacterium]
METAFALLRAVHEIAALIALGQVVYSRLISRTFTERARSVVIESLAISVVAALGWLLCEAANMSGLPLFEALSPSVISVVLRKTLFGRIWVLRLILGMALCGWIVVLHRKAATATPTAQSSLLSLLAIYVATLALVGHAVAAQGVEQVVRIAADAAHLLAAGAWLGALPALAYDLAHVRRNAGSLRFDAASAATRRFSMLGIACVGTLIATGTVNAWYLVGSRLALIGTPYGHWLLAKLALFAAMIALAAHNRQRLAPRIGAHEPAAPSRLARNASIEFALGAGVIAIVGHLGITVPAIHDRPMIPALLASGVSGAGFATGRGASPIPLTDDVVARGRASYLIHCVECHGTQGRGDGPRAASLPVHPADLAAHGSMHSEADLHAMIANGIPGTPMPAFWARLSDREIWELVQYVRALAGVPVPRATPATHHQ